MCALSPRAGVERARKFRLFKLNHYNRPVRKFYKLQSRSTTAYKDTPRRF
ncbi:MAG: hypothetical protein LBR79_00580 [Oscillospiraceae bacterium]|nr:hypothetical protein [Oscillospiraceae bacterium]